MRLQARGCGRAAILVSTAWLCCAAADAGLPRKESLCEDGATRIYLAAAGENSFVVERMLKGRGEPGERVQVAALDPTLPGISRRYLVFEQGGALMGDPCYPVGTSSPLSNDHDYPLDVPAGSPGSNQDFRIRRTETLLELRRAGSVSAVVSALGSSDVAARVAARRFVVDLRLPRTDERWRSLSPAWIRSVLDELPKASEVAAIHLRSELTEAWFLLRNASDEEHWSRVAASREFRESAVLADLLLSSEGTVQHQGCRLVTALQFGRVCEPPKRYAADPWKIDEVARARFRYRAGLE